MSQCLLILISDKQLYRQYKAVLYTWFSQFSRFYDLGTIFVRFLTLKMKILNFIRNHILPYWKTIIIICAPLVLLPLPILSIGYSTEKVIIDSRFFFNYMLNEIQIIVKGGAMWLCHFTHGHLLDDRSSSFTHHQFDSCRSLSSFRNYRYRRRLHGVHEGCIIVFYKRNYFKKEFWYRNQIWCFWVV